MSTPRPGFLDLSIDFPPTYVKGYHKTSDLSKMTYNVLGNTGMKVSNFGFGAGQLPQVHETEKEAECIKAIKEAVKSGVNYIDTAPWYGFGTSEIVLGKALQKLPRQSYYIATKVGRYQSDYPNMFDFTAQKTLDSVNVSLKKLGVEYLDIIQVHDVEFAPSIDIIVNETLPALQKIKESGKAKYIGITGYPLKTLKEIIERSHVTIDTVLSYCRYNLFDQELLKYIPFFKERGIGLINASYLGMGLLTPAELPIWHCATEEIKLACKNANEYCRLKNVSLPRLATRYALALSDASTHLVGFNSLEFLHDNMKNLMEPLDQLEEEVLEYIIEKYFKPLRLKNWEGMEVAKYWQKIQAAKLSKQ